MLVGGGQFGAVLLGTYSMRGGKEIKVAIKQLKSSDVPNARVSDMNMLTSLEHTT